MFSHVHNIHGWRVRCADDVRHDNSFNTRQATRILRWPNQRRDAIPSSPSVGVVMLTDYASAHNKACALCRVYDGIKFQVRAWGPTSRVLDHAHIACVDHYFCRSCCHRCPSLEYVPALRAGKCISSCGQVRLHWPNVTALTGMECTARNAAEQANTFAKTALLS
jgi:hypothetical protein